MIAKNKDDTVIIASSSPTIIQKESAESSGGSTVVSSSTGSVSSVAAGSTLPVVTNNVAGAGVGATNAVLAEADAELVTVDQALYESVRQLPLPAAGQLNVIAVAAAAANDPQQQHHHHQQQASGSSSFQAGNQQQLPTVSTQSTLIEAGLVPGPPSQPAGGHAPLNTTNTMKQAPSAANAGHAATSGPTRPPKSGSIASGE